MRAPSLLFVATLVLGCRSESDRAPAERARPVEHEDPKAAAKRACIDELVTGAQVEDRFHPLLRSLCAEWINNDIPGVALAVVEGDRLVLHAERGVTCAGRDESQPIDVATSFRVGSISKTFTAALVLAAMPAQADLSLDTQPSDQLPELAWPAGLEPADLDALLRHESGLGELDVAKIIEDEGEWRRSLTTNTTGAGAQSYANTNYIVIGAMLEAATGQQYEQLLRAHVAEPLGLSSVTSDPARALSGTVACGHIVHTGRRLTFAVDEDLAYIPDDARWLRATGGVMATAEDLARFALAIGSARLPATAPMLEPSTRGEYGIGVRSWIRDNERIYGHSGNNGIQRAELVFVAGDAAIAILSNSDAELPATRAAAEAVLVQSRS